MTDTPLLSGRTSGFAFAKQTTPGTYVAPTDLINTTTFDATDDPQVEEFQTLNLTLDEVFETREGVHRIGAKSAFPLRTIQGLTFLEGIIGPPTMSGSSTTDAGALNALTPAGSQLITLASAPPAPPTGYGPWDGTTFVLGSGGTQEILPALTVTGAVVTTLPTKFDHPATDHLVFQQSAAFNPVIGADVANLALFSLVAQYAHTAERRVTDAHIGMWSLTGDAVKLNTDVTFMADQPLVDTASSLTSLEGLASVSELADRPFIQRDGGLITPFAPGDTAPTLHNRLTQLKLDINLAMQQEKLGGQPQGVEFNVVGGRTIKMTFQEYAGQAGSAAQIYENYVNVENEMPAWLWYKSRVNNRTICAVAPRAVVTKYDRVGPTAKPIGYDGALTILPDTTTRVPLRIVVANGVTYA